jgi:phospholipase/carboxylesterase
MLDPSLFGRLLFAPGEPVKGPLLPGRNPLHLAEERDAILFVPTGLGALDEVPLFIMFHGAGGFPEKVLPFIEEHAERQKFLILAPHSMYATWDIVIGGSGPDLERLHDALAEVTSHYRIDRRHLAFAGFSDGASYALSIGITNGDIASHVIAFSGGFMSIFMQEGAPEVFIAHGSRDEQLPVETSGRANANKLKTAGYDVQYIEFDGLHSIQPDVVNTAIQFFLK